MLSYPTAKVLFSCGSGPDSARGTEFSDYSSVKAFRSNYYALSRRCNDCGSVGIGSARRRFMAIGSWTQNYAHQMASIKAMKEDTQRKMEERVAAERARSGSPSPFRFSPTPYQQSSQNDQYAAAFESWKQQILATTAVTYIEAGSRMSVWVRLTPDKYASVAGAQSIARQLAISYCRATGVQRAHFYVMLGNQQFADAWSQ